MYAVCDLAWSIILSKSNFILKDFPAEPILSSRFFADFDKTYSNVRKYLPPDLAKKFPVKPGFDMAPPSDDTNQESARGTRSKSKIKTNQVPTDDSTVLKDPSACEEFDSTLLDCTEPTSNSRDADLTEDPNSSADEQATQISAAHSPPDSPTAYPSVPRTRAGTKRGTHRKPPGGESSRRTRSSDSSDSPSAAPVVEEMKSCQVQVQRMAREEVERYTSSDEPQDMADVSPPDSPMEEEPKRSTRSNTMSAPSSVSPPDSPRGEEPKRSTRSGARSAPSSEADEPQDSPGEVEPKRSTRSGARSTPSSEATSKQRNTKREREISSSRRSKRSRTSSSSESSPPSQSMPSSGLENGETDKDSSATKVPPNYNDASEILNEVNTVTRQKKRNAKSNYLKENNSSDFSLNPGDSRSTDISINSLKPAKKGKSQPQKKNDLKSTSKPTRIANKSPEKIVAEDKVIMTRTMRSKQEMESQRSTRQNQKNKPTADSKRR